MADQESQNPYPLVEVKIAELASKRTYRDTAELLKEWIEVTISHQTVGSLLKRLGEAQAREDEEIMIELEESAVLPEGKKVDRFYVEADVVFVRGTTRKKV